MTYPGPMDETRFGQALTVAPLSKASLIPQGMCGGNLSLGAVSHNPPAIPALLYITPYHRRAQAPAKCLLQTNQHASYDEAVMASKNSLLLHVDSASHRTHP